MVMVSCCWDYFQQQGKTFSRLQGCGCGLDSSQTADISILSTVNTGGSKTRTKCVSMAQSYNLWPLSKIAIHNQSLSQSDKVSSIFPRRMAKNIAQNCLIMKS